MQTLETKKLELIEWLAGLHDEQIISELVKWKDEHQPITIDEYDKELENANAEIEAGEFLSHEQALKEISAWRD